MTAQPSHCQSTTSDAVDWRTVATLRGVIPIVVTPFAADGSVGLDQFDRQVEFLRACGVRWVGFGFGSEVQKLSPDELSALMARAVAGGDGELRVIGNAELTSAEAGAAAIRRAAAAGAEAVLVRPYGLAGMPADAVIEAIAAAARAGGLPVVVQDAPQNTGVTLSAAALAELMAGVDEVVAVKIEPASPVPKVGAIAAALGQVVLDARGDQGATDARPDGAGTILGGLGGLHFPYELARGAVGMMPGPAIPELFQAVQRCHDAGDEVGAFDLWARALPLIVLSLRDPDTFLTVQKYLLTQRGVLAGNALRPPHGALDSGLLAEVDGTVERINLWELLDECAPE